MDNIIEFMTSVLNMDIERAKRNAAKICKYPDIEKEFLNYIATHSYPSVVLEGMDYSARDIHHKAGDNLNCVGVFNFLVSLRDTPKLALKLMEEGFVIK